MTARFKIFLTLEETIKRNRYITAQIYLKKARESICLIAEDDMDDPDPIGIANDLQTQIDNLSDYIAEYCQGYP